MTRRSSVAEQLGETKYNLLGCAEVVVTVMADTRACNSVDCVPCGRRR